METTTKIEETHSSSSAKAGAGFGNYVRSEALKNALPKGQNNPQKCPYGLYAEQLSGTAFTRPRHQNLRSWLYRIRPSVQHEPFTPSSYMPRYVGDVHKVGKIHPDQMRWMPMNEPSTKTNFIQGLTTMGGSGDPASGHPGFAIHMYTANADMKDTAFCNGDGDFLIIPQSGTLIVRTEFGFMCVPPQHICVVMRGMRFSISIEKSEERKAARGYVLELFQAHLTLPDLGPIGSNGLANPQDFEFPAASFEDREDVDYHILQKLGGAVFEARQRFSPFNVVAYQGNYVPYTYDLRKFCCMNSVTYDHPDPSIYTVLTCQSDTPGRAVVDFVIFPPRWMVMEHSFRPPWFHRNCMSEFMGLIAGAYDAKGTGDGKKKGGFVPGGASLHSPMTPHGPDGAATKKAIEADLKPEFFGKGLAFMLETSATMKLTDFALRGSNRDVDYYKCWESIPRRFDPTATPKSDAPSDLMSWRAESRE
eukprot:g1640.t1